MGLGWEPGLGRAQVGHKSDDGRGETWNSPLVEALMRSKVRLVARSRSTTPTLLLLPSHPNLKMPGAARSAQPPAYATMGVI